MSVDREQATTDQATQTEDLHTVAQAPAVAGVDPVAVLARVARDRADPGLALGIARARGNRSMQRSVKRLARSPADEVGTYLDPTTDQGYAGILPLLRRSPWGRDAISVMNKYSVKTYFAKDGPPANFAQELNRVRLNMSLRDDVISAYYVHEMYHASQFHEGKSPGPSSHDDMGKWVKILVDEEIEGTALGYLHKLQIERTEPKASADDKPPHMNFFRNAFDAGFKAARAEGKDIDAARAEGRARGRKMAAYLIRPSGGDLHRLGVGEWLSYTQYYEHEWQREQQKKAAEKEKEAVPAAN